MGTWGGRYWGDVGGNWNIATLHGGDSGGNENREEEGGEEEGGEEGGEPAAAAAASAISGGGRCGGADVGSASLLLSDKTGMLTSGAGSRRGVPPLIGVLVRETRPPLFGVDGGVVVVVVGCTEEEEEEEDQESSSLLSVATSGSERESMTLRLSYQIQTTKDKSS